MASNRGVVYVGTGKVEVRSIDFPKLIDPRGKRCDHGVILKVVSTNICGSDQHMVRGRTTAQPGLVLGHEITGEVIEVGRDVQFHRLGRSRLVPFNVACGRCRTARSARRAWCLNVNPERAGGAYGYVDMGGWIGGQAEYVMVPYADFNLLRFPDKDRRWRKSRSHLPHRHFTDGIPWLRFRRRHDRSTVLIAGAGPVGLAAAASALLLGAAVTIVMDFSKERLAQARTFGCETLNLSEGGAVADHLERILGVREVDCAVDCVGFEAKGHGGAEQPAIVLNQLMDVTRAAGSIGIPGLYVTEDPGAKDEAARSGSLGIRFGLGWAKSHSFVTGQTPVMKYHRALMMAVLHDRIRIAKAVNATVIPLDQAPRAYADFDRGAARKFVIDPHGLLGERSTW